ncbi:MAG TPA: tetratricopeptide repeat protein [Tepidisphaeraceae bacterium]|nr:tetratricopeptide repeat protein [Tepidisphaeraceae bacterium]
MNIRPKTVRRLTLLFAAGAVAVGGIGTWLAISQHRIQLRTEAIRTQAVAAYDAGDYARAVKLFGEFFNRSHASQNDDAEAIFDYAKSRANTPADGGRNIYEAIGVLEQYLTLDPSDSRDARHLLLRLYAQARYNKEAERLAENLLDANPADAAALASYAEALNNDGNFGLSLAAYQKLNRLSPHNLKWQTGELELMAKTRQTNPQILAHVDQLVNQHSDDPTLQALASVAQLVYARDAAAAKKHIEAAAKLPPPDPETALQIVRLLDVQQDSGIADDFLSRAMVQYPQSPQLLGQLIERTWERQQPSAVLERLAKLDPATAEPALLGYKAMALFETGQGSDAKPLIDALSTRTDDASKAWSAALGTAYVDRPAPAAAIHRYAEAIVRDPTNPVFHSMLGQIYSSIGDIDQAVRQWNEAGRLSPAWALPYCQISRTLCASGRFAEAMQAAQAAHQRSPGTRLVETTYAWAWYGLDFSSNTKRPDTAETSALVALLANIQKAWPNEPITLPLYVDVLVRRGDRQGAAQAVRDAIASTPPPAAETFVQLASLSRTLKLGLDEQILQQAQKLYSDVPAVALARAMARLEQGNSREAIQTFEDAHKGHGDDVRWQISRAQLADAASEPNALNLWTALADAHPQSLLVQLAALNSPARTQDRGLWRRSIDRIKAITGAEGQLWKIEEARWQLAGQPSEKELAAVVASLQEIAGNSPSLAVPHRLLAEALLKKSGPDSAAKALSELTTAHDLRPDDFETTARLVEILASQGQRDLAIGLVDSIVRDANLSRQQRLWAADLYAKLGSTNAAIKLLTDAQAGASDDAGQTALLAQLYRRAGRTDDSAAAYRKILSAPSATPEALAAGAEFFAASHQPDTVTPFVERLNRMSLKPGALAILAAHLDELSGHPEQGIALLATAVGQNPKVVQLWQELAGAWLRLGKMDNADRAVSDGLAHVPGAGALAAMRLQIARLRLLTPQDVGPLLEVISHDPQQPVADQAIKIMADARVRNDAMDHVPGDRVLASLRQLASRHEDFLPLEELLVQRYAGAGRLADAADVAARASAAVPDDPEPLRLLCAVQSAAGNWDAVRQAASQWRTLLGGNTLEADLALARAELRQTRPDPDAAIAHLSPHMAAGATPQARQAALPDYCAALIGAGRAPQAAALLEPDLKDSSPTRLLWLELAAAAHKDADAALAWMAQVVPLIPTDSIQEKLALADAWEHIGTRFDSQAAHESARDALKPIVQDSAAPAQAWSLWAAVNQSLDNLPEAEHGWRQYLQSNPADPRVMNNLAYMLLLEGGPSQLAEAEHLATSAVAADPSTSTFYDTLARIQLRLGKRDDAVKNFRAALDRNPANIEAMIGLADVLQSRPQDREEARSLLTRIDAALRAGTPIATPLRKQLDRVKSAITSSL